MPFIIEMWCDGACRNNGGYRSNKPVVAGAGLYYPRGKRSLRRLYRPLAYDINQGNPAATSNRAELLGLIMALETALEVEQGLHSYPWVNVYIRMDSLYVQKAMTEWRYKWERNGWRNAKGGDVANQDLIRKAIELEEDVEDYGADVYYIHVPRKENQEADELANDACDEAADDYFRSDSYSSSGSSYYY